MSDDAECILCMKLLYEPGAAHAAGTCSVVAIISCFVLIWPGSTVACPHTRSCPAVSTPCGHTFCKPCFSRAMDHGSKCPMCRTVLHVGRELAVTITLKNLLERSFPGGRLSRFYWFSE